MICYLDTTYCASPGCKNECGRQLTPEIKREVERAGLPIAMGYFCGEPKYIEDQKNQ